MTTRLSSVTGPTNGCVRNFEGHGDTVRQVMFDPTNNESFASSSLDHTVKVIFSTLLSLLLFEFGDKRLYTFIVCFCSHE